MSGRKIEVAASKSKKRKPVRVASADEAARKMQGQQLRAAREARGMSQVDAARAMGWGKDRLCRVENGTRTLSALHKGQLCQLYGVSEAQLESLREGSKQISGRYMSLPVVDRHAVAKSGGKFQLNP